MIDVRLQKSNQRAFQRPLDCYVVPSVRAVCLAPPVSLSLHVARPRRRPGSLTWTYGWPDRTPRGDMFVVDVFVLPH